MSYLASLNESKLIDPDVGELEVKLIFAVSHPEFLSTVAELVV